jgi:hypothetical protein
MKYKFNYGSYFFILFFCIVNMASASENVEAVDMWDEPRHQLLFSKGHVRLLLVNIPAGDTSLLHKHEYATSYVLLRDALMTSRMAGGEWSAPQQSLMRDVGKIADRTDYSARPFAHQVRNVSSNTFKVFAVVNTHPGKFQGVVNGNTNNEVLLDNDWFREHRLNLSSGELSETLKFAYPAVVIQVSEGSSDVVNQHSSKTIVGAWSFHEAGKVFQLRNSSDKDVKLLLLEVK